MTSVALLMAVGTLSGPSAEGNRLIWRPPQPPPVAAFHVDSAMQTSVGAIRVAYDLDRFHGRDTLELRISNLDVKMTCHPIHVPDGPPVRIAWQHGWPALLGDAPYNPTGFAVLTQALMVSLPTELPMGETVWQRFGPFEARALGAYRLESLEQGRAQVRASYDLEFPGVTRPAVVAWTAVYDAVTGTLIEAEGQAGGFPRVEGKVMRVDRLRFTVRPGKVGRQLRAECNHLPGG